MDSMRITWLGHSCFMISADGYDIVIDPYDDNSVFGLAPITDISADEVLCSHSHGDHGAAHVIKSRNSGVKSPFTVEKLNSYHDDVQGTKRGKNIIHKISYNGVNAVHFGDIGCIPDNNIISAVRHADAIMIPVGGHYTVDATSAKKIADLTEAKIVIPMHYRSNAFGFSVLSDITGFTNLCDNVIYYENNYIDITKNTETQTAILSYINPKL